MGVVRYGCAGRLAELNAFWLWLDRRDWFSLCDDAGRWSFPSLLAFFNPIIWSLAARICTVPGHRGAGDICVWHFMLHSPMAVRGR